MWNKTIVKRCHMEVSCLWGVLIVQGECYILHLLYESYFCFIMLLISSHKDVAVVVSLKLLSDWSILLWWACPQWSFWFMNPEPKSSTEKQRAERSKHSMLIRATSQKKILWINIAMIILFFIYYKVDISSLFQADQYRMQLIT